MLRRWGSFAGERPDLAETGSRLLYQKGSTGFAYLATVAPDSGPRLHPVFPILTTEDLWLFIVNLSPKYRDLCRNGRYALHSLPTPEGGEEFYVRGDAREVTDIKTRDQVVSASNGRQGTQPFESLFCCHLESVLYTKWQDWGTERSWPNYTKWFAPPSHR